LHMAQLMPLPLTVSCSSKIQIGFTFLVPAYPGCPGKDAVKWLLLLLYQQYPYKYSTNATATNTTTFANMLLLLLLLLLPLLQSPFVNKTSFRELLWVCPKSPKRTSVDNWSGFLQAGCPSYHPTNSSKFIAIPPDDQESSWQCKML